MGQYDILKEYTVNLKKKKSGFSYCNIKNFVHSLKITIKNACEKSKLTRIILLNTKDKKKLQLN